MSHAAMWTAFLWVVRAGIALWFILMLRAAWKDKFGGTLVFGALLTLFIGVYPALHLSGLNTYIVNLLAGTTSDQNGVKLVVMAVLWCILFAVPGPFVGVFVQVMFRTFNRARGNA